MFSLGEMFANLFDVIIQIWEFVQSLFVGLILALQTLASSIPLVTNVLGLVGGILSAGMILFFFTYVIKFIIGR